MKVISYLNDVPFDELSYEEKLKFSREAQIKMLKIAGYIPVINNDTDKNKSKFLCMKKHLQMTN